MRIRVPVIALFIVFLVAGTAGCQRIAERGVEETTGIQIEEDGDRISVTGQDGDEYTLESGGGTLPADFPDSVPVYPDADIASSSSIESGNETVFNVALTSNRTFEDATSWYVAAFESEGWSIENQFEMEADGARNANYAASKDDLQVWVWVTDDAGELGITLQVQRGAE